MILPQLKKHLHRQHLWTSSHPSGEALGNAALCSSRGEARVQACRSTPAMPSLHLCKKFVCTKFDLAIE